MSIAIDVLLILAATFALWALIDSELIPTWISLLLSALFVTIALPRVGSIICRLRPISTEDAAEILDKKLLAKEQFLTLANTPPESPVSQYVQQRLNEHCSSASATQSN